MVCYGIFWSGQLRATKRALNPNLQVAVMHVWYVCSQLSSGLAQGMNGMHRMQSDMHV